MKYLLIPLLSILAASKVTLQSRFSKRKNKNAADNLFFNGIVFSAVALLFSPALLIVRTSLDTWLYGMLMGALSVAFQFFYLAAFSKGKVSLTVILNNFSMLIPMTVSLFLFDEPFGALQIVGTLLALASIVLNTAKDKNETGAGKNRTAWLIFTLIVFLSNGMGTVSQKIYSMRVETLQPFNYVAVTYLTAALLCFFIFFLSGGPRRRTPNKPAPILGAGLLVAVFLGSFQCLNTYAAAMIEGTVLYSTYNLGVALLLVLIGRTLFKERLTRKQTVGATLGIVSIVLMCL